MSPDEFDRTVHEPARLVLLTALASCRAADFVYLQRLTGLSAGNLSQHLTRLEQAELIVVKRVMSGRQTKTSASITESGRTAIDEHWGRLDAMRKTARRLEPAIQTS